MQTFLSGENIEEEVGAADKIASCLNEFANLKDIDNEITSSTNDANHLNSIHILQESKACI